MENKNYQSNNSINKQALNLFKEKNCIFPKLNSNNYFIYGEKNDCINDDIFFKRKEESELNYFDKNKSSLDLNLSEKNIHQFLNKDLIKALDCDLVEKEDNNDLSDSSSSNAYISGNSENSTNSNTPEQTIKLPKNKEDIRINLNDENTNLNKDNQNINNSEHLQKNKNNEENKSLDNLNDDCFKDKIQLLNDPLFAPIFIPNTINNIEKFGPKKENEHKQKENFNNKKNKKKDCLKNKFDDDFESIIMLSMANEEKTKLPLEIRVGDWICLYCNNLNFSFRIKCNRCGLLRKSIRHLLKKNYFNKYQYMTNNNYNNSFNMNL